MMDDMPTPTLRLPRSRALRYGVPAVVAAAAIGVGPVVNAVTADAHSSLPPRTAAQLLVDVQNARLTAASGTVVETTDLGLPAVPSIGGHGGDSAAFSSLLSGSHTMRVWYAGPDRVRLALLGQLGESDLLRNGSDVWAWSSHDNTATHWTIPSGHGDSGSPGSPLAGGPSGMAMTPQQAASAVLKAIGPSTRVSTDPTAEVAGRPAYQLSLVPRDTRSLVGSVRIAIDGATRVPTRVQVFARGAAKPALQVGFTSFSTAKPADSVFGFTPPPGATVKQGATLEQGLRAESRPSQGKGSDHSTAQAPQIVGKGWTTVVIAHLPGQGLPGLGKAGALLKSLPTVSGSWGSGTLLRSSLFSVVLTHDGRVAIGAVPPSVLTAALSRT
jgi:outer membrane lipoprotein-sorting protein